MSAAKKERVSHPLLTLENTDPIQMGFWVPNRVWATAKYLVPLRNYIEAKKKAGTLAPLTPVMQQFKDWVTSNSVYRMWIMSMINQANGFVCTLDEPVKEEIKDDDGDTLWIKDYDSFFEILNEIITTSPSFNTTAQVGTPMNGFLAIAMATRSGVALFHDTTFNEQFKQVLNAWNTFLKSPDSLDKLDINDPEKQGSWISKAAHEAGVWEKMEHNSKAPGYGFDSWNSFFIRQFIPNARPYKGNYKTQINIGCETTPWQYADNLNFKAYFWVKDANYSLLDLFGGQTQWAEMFVGGQLYQGFLSATHYHRWRSPLTGKLLRSWVQPGTYFAQRPGQGEDPGTWEGTESQPYLGHVAARAIFIFEHETCGYVAFICIGMVEVSTCVIEPEFIVGEGDQPIKINRDTEIGHFEFGGSTHMMVFQKDRVVLEDWAINATQHRNDSTPTALGSIIATSIPNNPYLLANGTRSLAVKPLHRAETQSWDQVFMTIDDLTNRTYVPIFFESNPFKEKCHAYYWREDLKYYLSYNLLPGKSSMYGATGNMISSENHPMLKLDAEGEVNNFTLHFYDENGNPLYFQIEDNEDGAFQRSTTPTVMSNYSLSSVGSQQGSY